MSERRKDLAAPLTAAALIAQQVAANAIRDGLFLTWFPVTSLPFFVAAAAILAVPAVGGSGRLMARFGPHGSSPRMLAVSGVLFFAEWILLGRQPQAATVLLYAHSSVLGAIAISAFWSLLNECFDPHAAKPLLARVAAAAAFGGLVGGVGAERIAAMMPRRVAPRSWPSRAAPPQPESVRRGTGRAGIVSAAVRSGVTAGSGWSGDPARRPCCATSPSSSPSRPCWRPSSTTS